jgi:hypothetical protein
MKWGGYKKIRSRVETQPRFKIQYPMKNHGKDAGYKSNPNAFIQIFF